MGIGVGLENLKKKKKITFSGKETMDFYVF